MALRRASGNGNYVRIRKIVLIAAFCLIAAGMSLALFQWPGQAEDEAKYVGTEVCGTCHAEMSKTWALTVHRRTLFNKDESRRGCEACHGPGSLHVAGGGDPTKIIKLSKLSPEKSSEVCLKCHNQEEVMLWQTGVHARAKLSCINCHNPHSLDARTLLSGMESAKLPLEGLVRTLKQAELAAGVAAEGSPEKAAALAEVSELRAKRDKLQEEIKTAETAYRRVAQPYLCFNCHKAQELQSRMPSHHPILEGKLECSDCHNPHGGPADSLRREDLSETCARCHAEKIGPFTFEHPPVTEDCTICHNPHGAVQNNLLVQSEPFLCLRCHVGPHSRGGSLGNPSPFARFYTECTDCHNQIHGSDRHQAFHY